MTENIIRMYKLANIEATAIGCTNEDIQSPDYYSNDCEGDCIDCTWYDEDEVFPPFSSEKQLELIKWISLNTRYMWNYIGQTVKNTWVLAIDYTQIFKFKSCEHADFSQALAGLVCELWEDLTPEQREEIRGILQ